MTTIKLDPGAALLLDALHGAGHAAYAVGGCVRDSLLGRMPEDWDVTTSALPEEPMTDSVAPSGRSKLTSRSTRVLPKDFSRCATLR